MTKTTDQRIAEFKFTDWKGGPESIRKNQLFKDFYLLAEFNSQKEKYLYVIGDEIPLKSLNGGRALSSVMSHHNKLWREFQDRYNGQFVKVCDYYNYRKNSVIITDLAKIVPQFAPLGKFDDEDVSDEAD